MPPKTIPHKPTKEVSVMAWIENTEGAVLMVKQLRGKKSWALPGGKVKVGESLRAALKRELFEESGLYASHVTPFDIYDRYSKNNISVLYRVTVKPFREFKVKDPEEIGEVRFKSSVPPNATPTLKYFFKRARERNNWM
jgi:ADP-ribose pyrophosphatase YjhB (NUDIX family)